MTDPILQIENITKRFPGVLANDAIHFDLRPQEIHALLGENGAGKSTLMNILYGLYKQDSGRILVNGQELDILSPNDALSAGIGMVHQHFMLVPVMTVTENLMLGHEKTRGRLPRMLARLDREQVSQEIRSLGERYGLRVDPNALVEDLSVGEAQRVEILKVLYKGAEILILDEPTAVLTPQETEELFGIMRSLVRQGKSIIFITHKLKEVMEIANRITVLRLGKVVGTTAPQETSMEALAAMMVGREVLLTVEKGRIAPGRERAASGRPGSVRQDQPPFGQRRQLRGVRRRGVRHRRGAGQRADRTGGGDHRAAQSGRRQGAACWSRTLPTKRRAA